MMGLVASVPIPRIIGSNFRKCVGDALTTKCDGHKKSEFRGGTNGEM